MTKGGVALRRGARTNLVGVRVLDATKERGGIRAGSLLIEDLRTKRPAFVPSLDELSSEKDARSVRPRSDLPQRFPEVYNDVLTVIVTTSLLPPRRVRSRKSVAIRMDQPLDSAFWAASNWRFIALTSLWY